MIDWTVAAKVADLLAGSPGPASVPPSVMARSDEFVTRVAAYTALTPERAIPAPEEVDRAAWVAANHLTMRPLLDPLTEKMGEGLGPLTGPLRSAGGVVLGAQVGALTGLLSQRVMGQYEVRLLGDGPPPRLLMVAPNLAEAAARLEVDHEELCAWVLVHETTHAVQFAGVPWLRDHLGGLLGELLSSLDVKVSAGELLRRPPAWEDLRALAETARRGDLIRLVIGPGRQELVDRIQATMSLIEGHAEHVMDAVGAELLPSLPRLRAALDRRRADRPAPWRVLERLLGLELKVRQYQEGKRFCDEVVRRGGIAALNRAWADPSLLPELGELADPGTWLARTHVPVVTNPTA